MRPVIRTAVMLVLVGCGMTSTAPSTDGAGGNDPPPGEPTADSCSIGLAATPFQPLAAPTTMVHVTANVIHEPSVPTYTWSVELDGFVVGFTSARNGSEIDFAAATPGSYNVKLTLNAGTEGACTVVLPVNVGALHARSDLGRLRIVPPPSMPGPIFEEVRQINGGATFNVGVVSVTSGMESLVRVLGPQGGVPAYLQLAPATAEDAAVEAFTDASGNALLRLTPHPHTVLVIPEGDDIAPRRITDWLPTAGLPILLDAGTQVTGAVIDPGNAALAGAQVQLKIDGVPSTVATTDSTGRFELLAAPAAPSAVVEVEVTPAAASELPRLVATSTAFNLGLPLAIRYGTNLARRDLAGTVVRRGAPLAHAKVTVVGTLAAVGMITAGTSANATGIVRAAASTDTNGVLPRLRVPVGSLSAVIEAGPGDLAVVALDTAAAPTSLDAPEMQLIATAALATGAAGLPGAVLDVVPTGALAMAGAAPLHVTADASGAIAALLASGGQYDLRFSDPLGRRAPRAVTGRVVPAPGVAASLDTRIETSYALQPTLQLRGTVRLDGNQLMPNASIQLLCYACTGIDRDRPMAEAITDSAGQFVLAVPDPGTM